MRVHRREQRRLSSDKRCDICGKTEIENGRRLDFDHDHVTGQTRGRLCSLCNTGLGFFKDDPSVLQSAIAYLRRSSSK